MTSKNGGIVVFALFKTKLSKKDRGNMNNRVLNYLQDKKTQLKNLTEDKFNQMKEHLAKNANEIKNTAKKAAAAGLIVVLLLGGMVGCKKHNSNHPLSTNEIEDGASHEPFEMVTPRPSEEINEESITAQDVLAVYDKLALAIRKKKYPRETIGPSRLEAYDKETAQFESITVETYSHPTFEIDKIITTDYQFPFFIKRTSFMIGQPGNQTSLDNKVYTCLFNYNLVNDNRYYNEKFEACGIIDYEFEDVMKAFNSPPSTITKDKLALGPVTDYFEPQLGQTCYAPMTIDRKLIQSANKKQLLSLYNMINSIYTLNIEKKQPENQEIESEPTN